MRRRQWPRGAMLVWHRCELQRARRGHGADWQVLGCCQHWQKAALLTIAKTVVNELKPIVKNACQSLGFNPAQTDAAQQGLLPMVESIPEGLAELEELEDVVQEIVAVSAVQDGGETLEALFKVIRRIFGTRRLQGYLAPYTEAVVQCIKECLVDKAGLCTEAQAERLRSLAMGLAAFLAENGMTKFLSLIHI